MMRFHTTQDQAATPLIATHTRFAFFPTVDAAGEAWTALSERSGDIFFSRNFLHAVESAPPLGLKVGYLLVFRHETPVGLAVCQIKRFSASESIAEDKVSAKDPCFFSGLSKWLKKRVSGWVDMDILICGNLLVTGDHGYWFDKDLVDEEEIPALVTQGLQFAANQASHMGVRISMILAKDIAPADKDTVGQKMVGEQYTEFEIQPNMVLHLPYRDFDAYLGAMSTKYRTRAKRAFKKAELLEKRELSFAQIQQESANMYTLYKEVATNAGFNMVDLNEHYMTTLHQTMQGKFRVFGYYMDNQLVCYCTTLLNGDELEAHFLGYNKHLNHDYQLYLNMLYDMIRVAFDSGCNKVVFARTALEIKSSVGAEPEPLYCYLCHQNALVNKFTGTLLDYLKPVEEWQQRHPFKDN